MAAVNNGSSGTVFRVYVVHTYPARPAAKELVLEELGPTVIVPSTANGFGPLVPSVHLPGAVRYSVSIIIISIHEEGRQ